MKEVDKLKTALDVIARQTTLDHALIRYVLIILRTEYGKLKKETK
jgi:hypothetical protein